MPPISIDRNTGLTIGVLVPLIAGVVWVATSVNTLTSRMTSIENTMKRQQNEAYSITQASEDAFREALRNPGHYVPDPRNPGQYIVVPKGEAQARRQPE